MNGLPTLCTVLKLAKSETAISLGAMRTKEPAEGQQRAIIATQWLRTVSLMQGVDVLRTLALHDFCFEDQVRP